MAIRAPDGAKKKIYPTDFKLDKEINFIFLPFAITLAESVYLAVWHIAVAVPDMVRKGISLKMHSLCGRMILVSQERAMKLPEKDVSFLIMELMRFASYVYFSTGKLQ